MPGSLEKGLLEAVKHDAKILVKNPLTAGRSSAPFLALCPEAAGVGEVLSADTAMYSYEAKYFNADSHTDLRPEFPDGIRDAVRDAAVRIF